MDPRPDIATPEHVQLLVDDFYARARADANLGPIFDTAIGDDWSHHLPIMYGFWRTLLLDTGEYHGNAFAKHIPLALSPLHFERWLLHFHATVDAHFAGPTADRAHHRAESIAHIFQSKLRFLQP